jgi:hypothetical protein
MGTVAVPALRGEIQTLLYRISVEAIAVNIGYIIVAYSAIDNLRLFLMGEFGAVEIGVAIDAAEIGMDGTGESAEFYKYRMLLSVDLACKIGVLMAQHAVLD